MTDNNSSEDRQGQPSKDQNNNPASDTPSRVQILTPLGGLERANRLVTLTRFSWGIIGFSAVAAIVTFWLGKSHVAVASIVLAFVGTILVLAANELVNSKRLYLAGDAILWTVVVSFVVFVVSSMAAFVSGEPCRVADFWGIKSFCDGETFSIPATTADPGQKRVIRVSSEEVTVYSGGGGDCPIRTRLEGLSP